MQLIAEALVEGGDVVLLGVGGHGGDERPAAVAPARVLPRTRA